MGATGSIASSAASVSGLNGNMTKLFQHLEAARLELALADERLFKFECDKIFKDHLVLIDLFTTKTKSQLRKFMEANYNEAEDIEALLGNEYGKFITSLADASVEVDLRMTKLALAGVGTDEELLVAIFCTRTSQEIQDLMAAYKRDTKTDLLEVVKTKTTKNAMFFSNILPLFFSKILCGDRYEGTWVDPDLAKEHASLVKSTPSVDFGQILDILCTNSRFHCAAVNEECIKQFDITLADIIKDKIGKGNAFEALRYWCSPLYESYVNMLHHFHKRTDIIFNTIARLNKRDLSAISAVAEVKYGQPLKDLVGAGISGNLKRAVVSWIEQPPFDGGCEDELNAWLVEQSAAGYTLKQLIEYPESCEYMEENLKSQIEFYQKAGYGRNAVLKKVESQKSLKKMGSLSKMKQSASSPAFAAQTQPDYSKLTESQLAEKKRALVKEYLSYLFELSDMDASDEMSATEFNIFLDYIDLTQFGYTSHEIDLTSTYADSDGSGFISRKEVLHEMIDMIIDGCEEKGWDVLSKVEKLLIDVKAGAMSDGIRKKKPKRNQSVKGEPDPRTAEFELPGDLQSYLFDTFEGFDLDQNKALDRNEFFQFMNVLNLGLSTYDIDALKFTWDSDADGGVSWKESLPRFVDKLHSMASDERDHYIGLYDKTSGYLFWYNLRDKSTQWMSEEDQAIYAPGARNREDGNYDANNELMALATAGDDNVVNEAAVAADYEAKMKTLEDDLKARKEKEMEDLANKMKAEYDTKMQQLEDEMKAREAQAKELEENLKSHQAQAKELEENLKIHQAQAKEQDEAKALEFKKYNDEKSSLRAEFEAQKKALEDDLVIREEKLREAQIKDIENQMKVAMLQKNEKVLQAKQLSDNEEAQAKKLSENLTDQMNKMKEGFEASQRALENDLKARQERQQKELQKRLDNRRKELMYELVVEEGLTEEEAKIKVDSALADLEDVIANTSNEDTIVHLESSADMLRIDEEKEVERLSKMGLKEEDFNNAVQQVKDLHKQKLILLESELEIVKSKERERLFKRLEAKNKSKEVKKEMRKNLTSEYEASLRALEYDLKAKQEKNQGDLQNRIAARKAAAIKKLQESEGLSAEEAEAKAAPIVAEEESLEAAISSAALSTQLNNDVAALQKEQTDEIRRLKSLGMSDADYTTAKNQCKELYNQKLASLDSALESVKTAEKNRLAERLEAKKKEREESVKSNVDSISQMKKDFDATLQKMEDTNANQEAIRKAKKDHEGALKALEQELKVKQEKEQKDIQKRLENKRKEIAKRLQEEQKISEKEADAKAKEATKEEEKAMITQAKEAMNKQVEALKKPLPPRLPTYLRGLDLDGDSNLSEADMRKKIDAGKQMQNAKAKELENALAMKQGEEKRKLQERLNKKKEK